MKSLPKIELHCHLDGSLRPSTVMELALINNIDLPSHDLNVLKDHLRAPDSCPSLDEYLKRFDLPIAVLQWEDTLERAAFELMEDAANDGVKYIEIRFAPLFHQEKGLSIEKIVESVIRGMRIAEKLFDIKGNIILSFLKFMPVESIYGVVDKCKAYLGKGVVAVDLAGSEDEHFAHAFVEAMAYAKSLGYRVTIHAGETGFGVNVLESIELLGAERIGHGVNIRDHKDAYDKVKNLNIALEMCPTSNIQTKAVKSIHDHPAYDFLNDGLPVTISTDNRTVSNTTMTEEFELCSSALAFSEDIYKQIYLNSIEAAFASGETKKWLKTFI